MAQIGVLRLALTDFVVYRDSVEFVTTTINGVDADWAEHQIHLQNDPEHQPLHSDLHQEYVNSIKPRWTSLLNTPMFEVKLEVPGAQRSGIH